VTSLRVFEHWDSDEGHNYLCNLNPEKGKDIELIYVKGA